MVSCLGYLHTRLPADWAFQPQATPANQPLWRAGCALAVTGTGTAPRDVRVRYRFGPVTQTAFAIEQQSREGQRGPDVPGPAGPPGPRGPVGPRGPAGAGLDGTDVALRGALSAETLRFGRARDAYTLVTLYGGAVCADARREAAWSHLPNGALVSFYNGQPQMRTHRAGIEPETNNTKDLGTARKRWDDVYATNGAINTSDRRLKREIAEIDLESVRELIARLEFVGFRWADQREPATTRTVTVEKTRTVTVEGEEIEIIDGQAVRRQVQKTLEEPLYETYPLVDAQGEPILDAHGEPRIHRVVQTEQIKVEDSAAVNQTFARRHFGVVAQQVEAVLGDLGIDPVNFAPLIKDAGTGLYGFRYTELVPILGRAIQDLLTRASAQEAHIQALTARLDALEAVQESE